MTLARRRFLQLASSGTALQVCPRLALAQNYPQRPVRVIVPFAPGGQTDVVARLVAQELSERMGKQFYVENAAGGGGNIGAGRAAQAEPDGYAILFVDGIGFAANPAIYSKIQYDAVNDFQPVAVPATTMQVLAVNPSVPASTVQELVTLIRASPGKFSYSSAGTGTGAHLTGELFRWALDLDMVHVPYGGGGPAIAATVAGHTPISFGSAAATIPQHREGKLRALAVGGTKRSRGLPEVPTMLEAGYSQVVCDVWIGVLAPAKTPADIVALLQQEMVKAVHVPHIEERLVTLGFEPASTGPQELAELIKSELKKWGEVVRVAHVKAN
ncbi:MAG: Bug family tripartite tricarboxylate transporter substrate binding protein [Xanthobacteraceae bacterium]